MNDLLEQMRRQQEAHKVEMTQSAAEAKAKEQSMLKRFEEDKAAAVAEASAATKIKAEEECKR